MEKATPPITVFGDYYQNERYQKWADSNWLLVFKGLSFSHAQTPDC